MPTSNRRLQGLLAAAGLLLLAAVILAATGNQAAARNGTAALRRAQADAALRGGVAQLEAFLFELDRFVLEAEPIGGSAASASEPSPTIVAALQGALAAPTAPALASASVYQDIDADEVEVPFVRLGSASADGAPALAAIPEEVLWDELEHADQTGGSTSLVWFSPVKQGGVRLHLAGTAMHEDTAAQKARLRLMHVSMPFKAPASLNVEVRCDIAAGVRTPELALARATGDDHPTGEVTDAIRPGDMPRMRWPVKTDTRPRARVHFAAHTTAWSVYLLAFLGVALLGRACLVLAGRSRAVAATPVSDSPVAEPPSPAPEDP